MEKRSRRKLCYSPSKLPSPKNTRTRNQHFSLIGLNGAATWAMSKLRSIFYGLLMMTAIGRKKWWKTHFSIREVGGLPILVIRATGFLSVRLARTSRNVCKLLEHRPKQKHQRLHGQGVILWRLI